MWPYDDYTWWVDAIHYATCPYMRRPGCLSQASGCAPTLEELNSTWDWALSVLRTGGQPVDSAPCFLFRHKALRKWAFAPASLAQARRRDAIAGFLMRNKSSHLEEPIPYPYSVWMKEVLEEWLPRPQCMDRVTGRFGPGACAEHFTHAERMLHLSRWAAQNNDHWPEVPNLREPLADHEMARLCAVPKQYDKDRLITVEPCYATFVQQAARQYILQSIHEGPLAGTCMDLGYTDGQSIQRKLALRASRKKNLATLDLKDASDRIGWHHVQQVFPPHILDWLWQARSTHIVRRSDERVPGVVPIYIDPLRIYAGMGNATTFPVETLFFAAFVYAYARAHGLRTYASVFGDDVICHSDTARRLVTENFPFFVVNPLKSFWGDDELRESCGIFAYKGVDITVPKVDGYPNTWDGRLGLCELHHTLRLSNQLWAGRLAARIAGTGQLVNWPFRLPGYPSISDEGEAWLGTGWSMLPETRWNSRLQRREFKVPIRRQKYKSYPLDWKRAKAINAPRPEEWLPAVLLGQVSTPSCRIDNPEARVGCSSVRFPLEGSYDISPQWVSPLG